MYKIQCFNCGYIWEMSTAEINSLHTPGKDGVVKMEDVVFCPACGEEVRIVRLYEGLVA